MGNTQNNWGTNRWNKETYGEMGETCRELPLRGFLKHLVSSFQVASYIAGISHELLPNTPIWANQYIAVHFFHGFLPHMVSYAKFTLMPVGGEYRSVILVLSFHVGSAAHT